MLMHDLSERKGIHLSLGGGAARGFAHIGVIRVLEEEGIPIASICGSSMGALVGGLYALHGETNVIVEIIKDYIASDLFTKSTLAHIPPNDESATFRQKIRRGFLVGKSIAFGKVIPFDEWYGAMKEMIPDKHFKDTQIPFFATGLDLTRKREVLFTRGSLRSAITASCSIPGVFPPVKSGQTVYVDGGWVVKVPVRPLLQMGAREILAVDVSSLVEVENPEPADFPGYSVILKSYAAIQKRLDQIQMEQAPVSWRMPVRHIEWADFAELDEIIKLGEDFARENIDQVHHLLKRQSGWKKVLGKIPFCKNLGWKQPPGYKPIKAVQIGQIGPYD